MDIKNQADKLKYDSWSKKDIYIAFMNEHAARKRETTRANKAELALKELAWEMKQLLKKMN